MEDTRSIFQGKKEQEVAELSYQGFREIVGVISRAVPILQKSKLILCSAVHRGGQESGCLRKQQYSFLLRKTHRESKRKAEKTMPGTRDVELTRSDGSGHRGSFSDTDKLESQL